MNGKKGSHSVEINISSAISGKSCEDGEPNSGIFLFGGWIMEVWKFCKEDMNRVIFSLKVGFAVLLVSLLILLRAPYNVFGASIIWSILTVAIMFEYTVGATFYKGLNRPIGSVVAGFLAIGVGQLALCSGHVAEPIIIGISIFIVGTITSFMKLWPCLAPYEYGFRVVLFTYCMIIVSGYRMGSPVKTAMDRLYSIAIGGVVAVLVNVLIFPIWAGEQLHKELVTNFKSVADALEECVGKYLAKDGSNHSEFLSTVIDEFPDEPAYKKCRSTLNCVGKLETLANSAEWEPPHGRFNQFLYPWSEYVKVGAVLRYCAYEVMALHGVLHSEIQAPYNLRITFHKEIQEATAAAAELVRCLGDDVSAMRRSHKTALLKKAHVQAERLQRAMNVHSYLLTPSTALSRRAYSNLNDSGGSQTSDDQFDDEETLQTEAYHEIMRKLSRSWPSREVDASEEDGGCATDFIPRMRALESTSQLSLTTFTSILVEFVARLDYLVEAVDDLSKMANFDVQSL